MKERLENYRALELGRIRPPSEATSLMIRVTRNCPWNKCTFCSLYKDEKFSIRKIEHVFEDIDNVKKCLDVFRKIEALESKEKDKHIKQLKIDLGENSRHIFNQSLAWYRSGMESIFLQDANSLVIKPEDMKNILAYIEDKLGRVPRITSYARSKTISLIADEDLKAYKELGLNRIHIGMESASDQILGIIKKGVDKENHILAGQKIKRSGIELSEYYMPGVGGREFSNLNAMETSDALNKIDPDFIRIRSFALSKDSEIIKDYDRGIFTRANDIKIVEELYTFINNLENISSKIKSDHPLNLITEVEGDLPKDKEKILSALKWYLDLPKKEQDIYRLGRRLGLMKYTSDLGDEFLRKQVEGYIKENSIDDSNIDERIDKLMNRFI